ncbi:MAG: PorT family protein [Muribaculaceae bacterium]|nr:PorT family protein [Muribaculaceae bacterium]
MINRLLKYAAVVALTIATAHSAVAIDFSSHNISVGVKGGASLSRVNFQSSVPQKMLPGMVLGASFRYIEEKHFGIIAEVNLEQRGWKEDFKPLEGYSYSRSLTYVQVPLLTHIYFGSDKARFFFNAGPEIGVMIGSKTSSNFDYENAASNPDFETNFRKIEQFTLPVHRKFDYGISAGLGMEVNVAPKHSINLEGRFYYGLNDVFRNHKTDPFQGSSCMSIMITLGYNIRLTSGK